MSIGYEQQPRGGVRFPCVYPLEVVQVVHARGAVERFALRRAGPSVARNHGKKESKKRLTYAKPVDNVKPPSKDDDRTRHGPLAPGGLFDSTIDVRSNIGEAVGDLDWVQKPENLSPRSRCKKTTIPHDTKSACGKTKFTTATCPPVIRSGVEPSNQRHEPIETSRFLRLTSSSRASNLRFRGCARENGRKDQFYAEIIHSTIRFCNPKYCYFDPVIGAAREPAPDAARAKS